MALAVTAAIALGTALVAGPSYLQYDAAKDAQKAQQSAEQRAAQQAREQATKAERDFNRLNQKKPNLAAMLEGNLSAASGGAGSTMLTGPAGVDMSAMKLGKTSLLGS